MTDIRVLTVTPPAGEWIAVTLHGAESPDGPWEPVQARPVTALGDVSIPFRPREAHGYYRTIWQPEGGLYFGEGETVRLSGATSAGKVARIGGKP